MERKEEESPQVRLFVNTLVVIGMALPWLLARLFKWAKDGQK